MPATATNNRIITIWIARCTRGSLATRAISCVVAVRSSAGVWLAVKPRPSGSSDLIIGQRIEEARAEQVSCNDDSVDRSRWVDLRGGDGRHAAGADRRRLGEGSSGSPARWAALALQPGWPASDAAFRYTDLCRRIGRSWHSLHLTRTKSARYVAVPGSSWCPQEEHRGGTGDVPGPKTRQ